MQRFANEENQYLCVDARRVCEKLIWNVPRFSILVKSRAFRCDFLKGKYSSDNLHRPTGHLQKTVSLNLVWGCYRPLLAVAVES